MDFIYAFISLILGDMETPFLDTIQIHLILSLWNHDSIEKKTSLFSSIPFLGNI